MLLWSSTHKDLQPLCKQELRDNITGRLGWRMPQGAVAHLAERTRKGGAADDAHGASRAAALRRGSCQGREQLLHLAQLPIRLHQPPRHLCRLPYMIAPGKH